VSAWDEDDILAPQTLKRQKKVHSSVVCTLTTDRFLWRQKDWALFGHCSAARWFQSHKKQNNKCHQLQQLVAADFSTQQK
jgi:hypothetical protein